MPFNLRTNFTTVSVLPHVFAKVSPKTKEMYRKKYKLIKRYGAASAITGVTLTEGSEFVKDLINSELKAFGYKSFFSILLGPVIQVVSLPLYVFNYGSRLRKFALATNKLGAKIIQGEMEIINWTWLGADLLFFGEPIPIIDTDSDFFLLRNETVSQLSETISEFTNHD